MRLRPGHDDPPPVGHPGGHAGWGVPPRRLADWAGAGLLAVPADVGPDGPELDLHDATLVRALCRPDHPGLRPAKLRATLDRLRAWLPTTGDPPAHVTLVDGGGRLLVRLADGTLADPTGQFRLDYAPPEGGPDAGRPATLGRLGPPAPTTAAAWHARGVDRDVAGDLPAAIDGYARALLLGGPDAQVTFDLAHALAAAGDVAAAAERYRQVVELEPTRQDAWVNLGDVLLTAGRHADATDAFRRALDLDPDDPDAHYGLADGFDLADEPDRAAPHWAAFVRLADGPPEHVAYARSKSR